MPYAFLLAVLAASAAHAAEPLSPRTANYTIAATYDEVQHTVTGRETLHWRNTSKESAPDLYFHLYLNAFANNRSSFVRATGNEWEEWLRYHPNGWGDIVVSQLRVGGTDLTARMRFVHPDDDNTEDHTAMRVPLDTPVAAGAAIDVDIDFVAKLPKVVARSGYAGPFAFVGQWFPKIGVYEGGAWNCHQYHLTTEFFADFGVYDVTLTVPRRGVVGATGVLRDEQDNGDGTKTLHFVAEDVHDFAWTIDPRFRVIEETIEGTHVRLLMQPGHLIQASRHLQALRGAMQRYREWIGPYPYPQLTVVDPGPGGAGAGGMEYPTLITVGTAWWLPEGLRFPEFVAVHEFGHQYWYGMVASNEFEEAWLDEGVNSYVEGRIMDDLYGPDSYVKLLGLGLGSLAEQRLRYIIAPQHDPMVRDGWQFLDRSSYRSITYSKTALVLRTLDGHLGGDRVRDALATYFKRWQFRHPHGSDLLAAINEVAGQDLGWYFEQVVTGTGVLDYAVTQVDAEEVYGFAGLRLSEPTGEMVAPEKLEPRQYRSQVVVERLGAVHMPVDVQVVFEDATAVTEHWDGRDRWKRFEYTGPQRVEWAVVDPKGTMPLDVDQLNNARMRESGTRGIVRVAGRWSFWFQNLVYFISAL